ncbi:hypothetical protein F2P81_012014 [Scophthalmus maximus]|uniref:Uncharacterized protein n=1 Tax=Scophthalmus maximus TaxID=52904 RepID=A0A6A4T3G9_SCOMX|nr:hypothetical protein F2P81_012014 [Scophthalmus maximus]
MDAEVILDGCGQRGILETPSMNPPATAQGSITDMISQTHQRSIVMVLIVVTSEESDRQWQRLSVIDSSRRMNPQNGFLWLLPSGSRRSSNWNIVVVTETAHENRIMLPLHTHEAVANTVCPCQFAKPLSEMQPMRNESRLAMRSPVLFARPLIPTPIVITDPCGVSVFVCHGASRGEGHPRLLLADIEG